MNSPWIKRLQREIKANPGKSAVLGLLTLVALYAWLPLLFGGDEATKPAAAKNPGTANSTAKTLEQDKKETFVAPSWRKLSEWSRQDARKRSASLAALRDPFAVPVAIVEKPKGTEVELSKIVVKKDITPQDARLILQSTLVSGQRKVAVINGKSYTEGKRLKLEVEKQQVQFTVAEIAPRRVVLENNGKSYELKLRTFELVGAPDEEGEVEDE